MLIKLVYKLLTYEEVALFSTCPIDELEPTMLPVHLF
jgi:hypothetical protein